MDEQLKQSALDFHQFPVPGKIQVSPTKPLATQRDLALAYSPGVAAPCLEIAADPLAAYKYTARGNLVAVISNGTAVLGLGNIGALAGKPVMEGKGVLFKKFSGIDVFDIEVDELDPDKLIDIIASLEPTFGGINLEDIKAPECFYIEKKLRERMKIPVFHDDQHGTADHLHRRSTERFTGCEERYQRCEIGGLRRRCGLYRLLKLAGGAGVKTAQYHCM